MVKSYYKILNLSCLSNRAELFASEWKWGVVVCQIWLAVDYTASTASIFNLFILSLDRYWSVSNPLRYLSKRTRKRALYLIGGTWAAASLWLVPLLAWHHIFTDGYRQHPKHVCETEFSDNITFKIVTSILNFYGPSALMVYLYCRIFRTIKLRSLDTLGRITPLDSSSHQIQTSPNTKKTFRNLTLLALPNENDKDLSTSFYKGIVVQVEYIGDSATHAHMNNTNQSDKTEKIVSTSFSRKSINHNNINKKQQNHQHHLACYPGSQSVWNNKEGSPISDTSNYAASSIRGTRYGLSGLRGLLSEKRGLNSTSMNHSSQNSTERKIGPINIIKEKKAARQLGVIMGAFFACWIPYFTLFPIIAFCDDCIPERMHMTAMWLGYLNSALNPVIYPLCNQHFRRAFARMLRCKRY
ncbi:Histamine H1 receptor [Armadillidium vulgare]|nr:Histamine H1 receptor [Armadillidium vulgare]